MPLLTVTRPGLWGAPLLFLAAGWGGQLVGIQGDAAWVLGVGIWMLGWWITEAVPIAVTSLLPIVLLPLTGVMPIAEATAPYGSHFVFLFLGGFLLAISLEKWELHRRLALAVLDKAGTSARRLVGAVMLTTALLSMWISNTATALMMLPIALSILSHWPGVQRGFAQAMLLGTAYAANIGGMATLIGTPPNVAMAGILSETHGVEIPFLDYMVVAVPFAGVMLFSVYWLLTRVYFKLPAEAALHPGGTDWIREARQALGPWSAAQKRVAWVFGLTAGAWIFRDGLVWLTGWDWSDTGIAVLSGVMLFLIPVGETERREAGGESDGWGYGGARRTLLQWSDAEKLPWDILLLFGGGLALAEAMGQVGWVESLAQLISNGTSGPWWWVLLVLITLALFLTEGMSNLALTVVMVPVVAALAVEWGLHPALFAVPIALASSCAFMLPMATPPNAIVFGSRQIAMREMMWVGLGLNLLCIALVFVLSVWVLPGWCEQLGATP